jgi:serine/threonine protein kinase
MKKRPDRLSDPARGADDTMREDSTPPAGDEWAELGSTRIIGPGETAPVKPQTVHEEDTAIVTRRQEPEQEPEQELAVLGDFELTERIGEGAMGVVFKARQISFSREVALKVLFEHVADNPKLVERLNREGRVMGRLDHPNIVQAFAVGECDGHHYVAMEFVDGESLQKWLNRLGRLELPDALCVAITVAKALGYAHEQKLVHRDIKPDNVLITRQGVIKVADLGMVKTVDEDMSLTQTGHAVGTPWYMPLEQARNAKETDGRSDIYALGCMLYYMLTGNPPFVGKTIVEVIQAKEQGTFATARSLNPEVPERLDLILAKMMAKLPRYRYQSCDEVIRDLESLNLASEKLGFLEGKTQRRTSPHKGPPSRMGMSVEVDPNAWYVRIAHTDGTTSVSKLSTVQVKKMLADGSLKPTAKASHQREEGFRALATYNEFQGAALSKVSKRAADAQGARFRKLMKNIEDKDRERDEKSKPEKRPDNPITRYWQQLWLPSLCVAGGMLMLFFLYYIATGLWR